MARSVRSLARTLVEDDWRRTNAFSPEVQLVNNVLLNPYAERDEMEAALSLWLQRHQPCVFGRVAAGTSGMHYCFLTEDDLRGTNSEIKDKIAIERAFWKQRALKGQRHGFMLVAVSPRLVLAAPDHNLEQLAYRLRELWQCETEKDKAGNDRALEHLYLLNPNDSRYYKFTFTVDFFAAAADGRWWQDHRVPGGIAFTANSLGHMTKSREWCSRLKQPQVPWAVKLSMQTIAGSQETPEGRSTWLLELASGKPVKNHACPFAPSEPLPAAIRAKDWTSYAGVLHTDHSIRNEFFSTRTRSSMTATPWLMDFTYIYDPAQADYVRFMEGQLVSEEEVFAEIGPPSEWRLLGPKRPFRRKNRPRRAARAINLSLAECESWALSKRSLRELLR